MTVSFRSNTLMMMILIMMNAETNRCSRPMNKCSIGEELIYMRLRVQSSAGQQESC